MSKKEEVKKVNKWRRGYTVFCDDADGQYKVAVIDFNVENKDAIVTKCVKIASSLAVAAHKAEKLAYSTAAGYLIKEKWFNDINEKETK
jgi:hypothetical protein